MQPADSKKYVGAMQAEINKLIASNRAAWTALLPGEVAIRGVIVFREKQRAR